MKHLEVAVAIVFRDSKVLVTRRKADAVLGGLWEFPGGKREGAESLEECVRREMLEELGMHVQPSVSLVPTSHQYPTQHITLFPFLCTHESGEPRLLACDEIRWVEPGQLRKLSFPIANHPLIEQVIQAFPSSRGSSPAVARHAAAV